MGGGASASTMPDKTRSPSGSALQWVRWRRRQGKNDKGERRQAWDLDPDSDSEEELELVFDENAAAVVRGAISHAFQVCEDDFADAGIEFGVGDGSGAKHAIHLSALGGELDLRDLADHSTAADPKVAAAEAELLASFGNPNQRETVAA
mmetsp:Transcript_3066/g.5338  ORF Transcript_3066/g.5338 Transcript_3066/m.5338 type:complete len:149 (-) Transcript_3066:176-622(-)